MKNGLTLSSQSLENPNGANVMKRTLLIALIGLTTAYAAFAQQSVSLAFSGPTNWTPGTSVTLQCTDTFLNFGGSFGLSYWLEVSNALAPSLTITSLSSQ